MENLRRCLFLHHFMSAIVHILLASTIYTHIISEEDMATPTEPYKKQDLSSCVVTNVFAPCAVCLAAVQPCQRPETLKLRNPGKPLTLAI